MNGSSRMNCSALPPGYKLPRKVEALSEPHRGLDLSALLAAADLRDPWPLRPCFRAILSHRVHFLLAGSFGLRGEKKSNTV